MEYFLVYAFFGWVYESIWCDVIYHRRGFHNHGVLFGPWLPLYGFGFFIILGIFRLLKIKKPVPTFIVGGLIATVAELIASYVIEATVGHSMWSYQGYPLNFDGRIALVPSLMFGLLITAAMCLIQPAIMKLQAKLGDSKAHNICFIIIASLFFIDLLARLVYGSNM
jgi:uncharacterized membrane protein